MTGEQIEADIFMGPTYYLRLKHMVKDKINYRARGPRTMLERQTVHGRAKDGGLRVGEMERDGIAAHGMEGFLRQSMLDRGDDFYMAVCNNTGTIAIYNESRNLFLSPQADGPIKFTRSLDDTLNVDTMSRFGRDFSVVRVPYTFKLLMHELLAMNVSMRIVTDKNVDQLLSMSFNREITIDLTQRDMTQTEEGLVSFDKVNQVEASADRETRETREEEKEDYQPVSPDYQPVSPDYQPVSPGYIPEQEQKEPEQEQETKEEKAEEPEKEPEQEEETPEGTSTESTSTEGTSTEGTSTEQSPNKEVKE